MLRGFAQTYENREREKPLDPAPRTSGTSTLFSLDDGKKVQHDIPRVNHETRSVRPRSCSEQLTECVDPYESTGLDSR